ncbi:MAG: DUF4071 domain-containing protein [Cyclobacteriaceae bacterium]|nr:DUF4071 domain-containing protein [Cyclobacteriaceae bacterium]
MKDTIQKLQNLVNAGRYLEARELAQRLRNDPEADPARVDQLFALSLSKSGSPEDALAFLDLAYRRNPDDPETAGILGGIYKELFKKHRDSKYAIQSRDTYTKNFTATRNYYTGINAATMSTIAGRASQGRDIASQVIALIDPTTVGFWELATLGEAYMLTKDRQASIDNYIRARQLAGSDWGKVISVYNQLWLLNHYMPVPKEIMRVFSPPTVVACIGHMIDHPGRTTPRFPAAIEQNISDAMTNAIRTMSGGIGYCSLACGTDIMFVEAMEKTGAEVHLFVPFDEDDFIAESVAFAGDQWIERYKRLVNKFPVTYISQEKYDGNNEIFAFQCRIIFGSAVLRSLTFYQKPMLLSVQSEIDLKRRAGGTRDTIRLWPFPDRHVNINPDQFSVNLAEQAQNPIPASQQTKDRPPVRPILYMVNVSLKDCGGMEKERVQKAVQTRIEDQLIPSRVVQTTDENLLLAFDAESGAIDFVQLVLSAATSSLQQERSVRLGMHAAPVAIDEGDSNGAIILDKQVLSLVHRISLIAPKGHVCASDQMAALLALNAEKFRLTYAGILQSDETVSQGAVGIYDVSIKV